MTCKILATGSKGNAVLLGGSILIDCGVPFKTLEPYLYDISLVLLTHTHSDHFNESAIRKLHQRRPVLRFACCANVAPRLAQLVNPSRITLLTDRTVQVFSLCTVTPFSLIHDIENYGYVVTMSGKSALYATDTRYIPISAPGLDLYMVEANYTDEDIRQRIAVKTAAGKFSHESRVMDTHMSQDTAVRWLNDNADPYKSRIIFLHQHHFEEGGDDP